MKILTEGAVTTEVGSLFQYSTKLTEKSDPLKHPEGVPSKAMSGGMEKKTGLDPHPKDP